MESKDPVPVVEHARKKRDIQRPQADDILVINSTSSSPIVGHAGIYLGDGTILSIEGPKNHPSTISLFQWMIARNSTKDTWTKVYIERPKTVYKLAESVNWGNNIRGKNFSYGITSAPTSIVPTYCSKIVFHSYWFASNGNGMIIPGRLVSPYALPNMFVDYGHADYVATYT
ncbi:hypothetical protein [Enterococcus faecalis]|uniref:hypothetical protein n=1 Tax=Enterococcus faecalis TaxID=1351 RepID=UPI0030C8AE1F